MRYKKYRKFIDPLDNSQKWLNELGKKGYKLESLRGDSFVFDVRKDEEYEYKSFYFKGPEKEVEAFLRDAMKKSYEVFQLPISAGQLSLGSFMATKFDFDGDDEKYKAKLYSTHIYILMKPRAGESLEEQYKYIDSSYFYTRLMQNKMILALIMFFIFLLNYFGAPLFLRNNETYKESRSFELIIAAVTAFILLHIVYLNFKRNKMKKS